MARFRFPVIFMLLCGLVGPLFSLSLSDLVSEDAAKVLQRGESLKKVHLKDPQFEIIPRGGAEIKATALEGFAPSLLVEALYFYNKPARGRAWTDAERLSLFNGVRALSTLSGIEYFSASRGKMRVFYEKSYVIAKEKDRNAQPDPVVGAVPDRTALIAFQKDLTFGENEYRYRYLAGTRYLAFVQENLTSMSYGIIPVLGQGQLRTMVIMFDTDDGILLYAASAARATMLPGVSGKVRDSFSNRADAIYTWFRKRADIALGSVK